METLLPCVLSPRRPVDRYHDGSAPHRCKQTARQTQSTAGLLTSALHTQDVPLGKQLDCKLLGVKFLVADNIIRSTGLVQSVEKEFKPLRHAVQPFFCAHLTVVNVLQ